MIMNVYAYFNKLVKAFDTKFQLDDHEDDKVVYSVSRAINARLALNKYEDLRFLQFYKIGTFDDESGEFVADKVLLLDLDTVIANYEAKQVNQEVKENGDKSIRSNS